jgi:GT2 family glycosyltransferase
MIQDIQGKKISRGFPRVAIILVNWNGGQVIVDCINSLCHVDYPDFLVIVVDNGSVDQSISAIKEIGFDRLVLLEMGNNLGFTGGNNAGIKYAKKRGAEYALLLNTDTEVASDFLRLLVETAEENPDVGIAGPMIYYHANPNIIWSAGGVIDWKRGSTRMVGMGEDDEGQFGELPRLVSFVTGCALLINLSVISSIGLLDERFFAYYEETEWCVRANRANYKIMHVPASKIWHKISPMARESSPLVHYYMTRNRLLFLKLTNASFFAWFSTLVLDFGRTLLSWYLCPKWRYKSKQRIAMVRGILDYFQNRFGKYEASF